MEGLQEEILRVGKQETDYIYDQVIEVGCRKLCLLSEDESLIGLIECNPWVRGGAETYVTSGIVCYRRSGHNYQRKIIAKAYCGFSPNPENRVNLWQERASHLAKAGVSVSKVYSTFKGVLFAEYIQWPLISFLVSHNDAKTIEWASKILIDLADALDHLNVHPISLLPDLRTDGIKIYLTDFGQDIGEVPGSSTEPGVCRKRLLKELVTNNFEDIAKLF